MNALYRFLKSVQLAIVLILVIIALSILATLVPQGMPQEMYTARYGPFVSAVVRSLSLGSFFSSAIFLVPVLLFTVNLGVCAADRLITRARNRAPRRYGPDLVHIGLLVLIAGALVTALGRQEKVWQLAVGEDARISPSYSVRLLAFEYLRYDNGSPREWTSTVSVTRDGQPEIASFPIKVNHPLRLKGMSVYQATFNVTGTLQLTDSEGNEVSPPEPGDYFSEGDSRWVFTGFEKSADAWAVQFQQVRGSELVSTRTLLVGDTIGPFKVRGISAREVTGLKAVKDPGFAPFLAALVLITAGLGLTFIQKRGDTTS